MITVLISVAPQGAHNVGVRSAPLLAGEGAGEGGDEGVDSVQAALHLPDANLLRWGPRHCRITRHCYKWLEVHCRVVMLKLMFSCKCAT